MRRPKLAWQENYVGPIVHKDDVVGKIVSWVYPKADQDDLNKIDFAVTNYTQYTDLMEEYQQAIQSSPFVQWILIPFLLGAELPGIKPLAPQLKPLEKS